MVRVMGREQPVRIYELLGNSVDSFPKAREQSLSLFAAGLQAYRQQFWQEASSLLRESIELWPEDGPSRIMVERCHIYQQTCPPEDWDCVFEMRDKE